ncbi:MAG: hypothetical protein HKN80_08555 [Acidimicrobiia bacterium]|nr:hypothetical protein [Acidimicrobiia bacterium]
MELHTVEARWFEDGPCPAVVAEWFHSAQWVSEPEARTDEYLKLPGRDDVGVKRRAGIQLDLKLRTGTPTGVVLPEGLDGPVEAWTKWSFPLGSDVSLPGEGSWIPVEKLRWSRGYAATGRGVVAVPPGATSSSGCAIELVELAIGRRRAWGFGFEAFGEGNLDDVLAATGQAVVADTPLGDITFTARGTHSYPAWLQLEGTAAG